MVYCTVFKNCAVTIKLLEENMGWGELHNIGLGHDFFSYDTRSKSITANTDEWNYIKLEAYVQQRKQSVEHNGRLFTAHVFARTHPNLSAIGQTVHL